MKQLVQLCIGQLRKRLLARAWSDRRIARDAGFMGLPGPTAEDETEFVQVILGDASARSDTPRGSVNGNGAIWHLDNLDLFVNPARI